ncbi:MAG: alpha-glucan family phosphorylase [Candidatus Obscuribacter sp.]|nr:alpha-glucan family phosphorylase [Candidatus Obscuribacter sp.]MBK9621284.1 alpha-glucan family phosphorylase [Candidatus Obscuribacter sp.]MBK9773672.1 alpha-glucan family phosphorylase [Candidatus Obscuribacter sp.]MBL0185214.1 alpha-glucan family phosphorylase [Candidatus Obscuribacter sp.]MBP6350755.1 alpha-glucan family phosphorylase [Candidatus Obscuribacter sp.]
MKPIRTVEVTPFLPPELECLRELAYNLKWTWDHETIKLFRRLDRDLWDSTGHNPVLLLGTISQERLNEAASDEGFVNQANRICQKHYEYMKAEGTWYDKTFKKPKSEAGTVAYFSAEFGLSDALPIYSGGLGILAGDHVKAASELGLPLVGVGIVYQQGYFRQYLNADGWQQERYPINDFYNLPIIPVKEKDGSPVLVSVDFPGRKLFLRIWKAQVGRVPLYLLDTNIPENSKVDEDITDALYKADREIRIQQEIILGIGGMRALKAVGIEPTVCHMNEGHSAFLGLERIRILMEEQKLTFAEAKEVAAAGQIFTTHTAVPAGIDKFAPELVDKYMADYYRSVGLSRRDFFALGRINPDDETELFSMANLAINLSSRTNAVSKLHGVVSRELFKDNWKNVPEHEVPISHITNGVHTRSWISKEMADLFDRYLGPKWSEDISDQNIWNRVADIPDNELWRIHEMRRQRLVNFCRKRLAKQMEDRGATLSELDEAASVLDPEVLTIGFARRMATYKRATLLLKDPERLAKILTNKHRPVQIIMAGKAHPEDQPAKELIRQVMHFCRREDVRAHFVFLEDYDMNVARWMVEGVDVWLNTPVRFAEASGTSGMKVAFNGGLNLSILDGWWDEAYEPHLGWAIGRGEVYDDTDYQAEVESNALYDLLEKEIVPAFYTRDQDRPPKAWLSRMKKSMLSLCPVFNINRMVREYTTQMYIPSLKRYGEFLAGGAAKAKQMSHWKQDLKQKWSGLRIGAVEESTGDSIKVGDDMTIKAWIDLGELTAEDVVVQIYHGPIDNCGDIADGVVIAMKPQADKQGTQRLFTGHVSYSTSGRHGYTVRILPHHKDTVSPFDTPLILWANQPQGVKV